MAPENPADHDPPYLYECMFCEHRLRGDGVQTCPRCGSEMKNVSKPSANPGLSGPSY